MINRQLSKKIKFFLFFLLISFQVISAQVLGDFRSLASGAWNNNASWQRFDGTTWVNATAGVFPGATAGSYSVKIQTGHIINGVNAANYTIGNLTINGMLRMNTNGMTMTITTPYLHLDGGTINYNVSASNLVLPANVKLDFSNSGAFTDSGACNANKIITIGTTVVASCSGGGAAYDFATFNALATDISSTITKTDLACLNKSVQLQATGSSANVGATFGYSWSGTGPSGYTYGPSATNPITINQTTPGIYTFTSTTQRTDVTTFTLVDVKTISYEILLDSDGDCTADTVDLDDDNDGILDSVEGYTCGSDLVINDPNPTSSNIFTAPPTTVTLAENTASAAVAYTYSTAEFPYGGGKVIDPGSIGSKVTYTFTPNVTNLEFWLMDFDNQEIVNINYYDASGNRIANLLPYITQIVSATVGSLGLTSNATYGLATNPTNNIGAHTPMQDMVSIKTPFNVSKIEIYFSGAAIAGATPDYFIKTACAGIDTDGDTIPNYLDLDSDNDGCFDAIEGDENVVTTQIITNGSIAGGVDAQGIPVLVNSGGAADSGGDQGQGIGQSRDITKNDCLNSDGDSLPDWQDLDDDNDGILDTTENTCNLTGASGGHLFWDLDTQVFPGGLRGNSLAPDVTGTVVSFGPGLSGTTGANAWDFKILNSTSISEAKANDDYVQFTIPLSSTATKIYEITQWSTYGYSASLGPKVENLSIEIADNAAFNNPSILYNGSNPTVPGTGTFYVTNLAGYQLKRGITYYVRLYIYGSNSSALLDSFGLNVKCFTDTDGDGIPDYLDLDSDNDNCLDAVEGGNNLPLSNLVSAGGTLSVGTGSTALNQNLCGGTTCVGSTGIPTIVNQTTGQSVGSSANAGVKAAVCVVCYNDANTAMAGIDSKHGITLLKRAGTDNGNWPMIRKSAHTVLESNTKGFVVTRMTSDPAQTAAANHLNKITNPQEGMMVYDLFSKCLKIYADGVWSCFSTPTCQ